MSKLKGLNILVVDDDEDIRELISMKLSLHKAKCDEAKDGAEAFEKIKAANYDCVITDVRMPNASGIDLIKMIRSYEGKSPRVIMMSAFTDLSNDAARNLGAIGLFMKPDDLDNLVEMIINEF